MYMPTLKFSPPPLLEHLPVAIIIVGTKGLVHYHNQEADRLLSADFFESANVTQWSNDFNQQDFFNSIDKLNNNSPFVKFNISLRDKQITHYFELKMIINPDEDNTQEKDFYLITLNVVNEPSAFHKEPSAPNKEPTAYKKNFKELKQFSRLSAMREISSSLADKLNQPLTAILSYTQAMQRLYQNNSSSNEIAEAMERVVINAQNAGNIIKDIRAQLDVNTLNPQNICINELIKESVHLTELESPDSPINFITHYEPSYTTLCIDKIQMRQVIFSILNNAIDAVMEDSIKSPEITLTTRLNDSNYEIIISDNGPGFPEEVKGKLFEPFTTTKKNGIGIGLSMCHHIIDLHKGSISIAQPVTVVTICLPLVSISGF